MNHCKHCGSWRNHDALRWCYFCNCWRPARHFNASGVCEVQIRARAKEDQHRGEEAKPGREAEKNPPLFAAAEMD